MHSSAGQPNKPPLAVSPLATVKKTVPLLPEEVATIIERLTTGESRSSIARDLGRSTTAISRVALEVGIPAYRNEDSVLLRKLVSSGATDEEIHAKVYVTQRHLRALRRAWESTGTFDYRNSK